MNAAEALTGLVKSFEGLRLKSYLCPAGIWTIGYGSTGPGIVPGLVWSKQQCESRMAVDANKFLNATKNLCPGLTGAPLGAVADFAYNLGATRLAGSTLRRKLNKGNYYAAAAELKKWVNGGGKKLPGLVLRRDAEGKLILNK